MTDAWSVNMKDLAKNEESETSIGNLTNGANMELVLNRLISRMDAMETRAAISDNVLEDVKTRLMRAETRINPHDRHKLPWRTIGKNQVTVGSLENGGEVEFKPEEEYQLPFDIYSVISSWCVKSRPFKIALLVIVVQITLLGLLLLDQFGSNSENEIVAFPANVPAIVHASQALATIIAIMDQDDLRSAIEGYFDGLPTRFKGCIVFQRMTPTQWNFSCFVRFFQGLLSVFASFTLAVQSDTVFDVLLNFLGVKFISELDDLAFTLAGLGYFGKQCEDAAKAISEVHFQQDDHNKSDGTQLSRSWFRLHAHVIGIFSILGFLLGLFFFVLISQNNGDFSTEMFAMSVEEDALPFAAIFRGCYRKSSTHRSERRPVYEQVGFEQTGAKFGYCGSLDGEKGWTFTIGEYDNPCDSYAGRSEATNTFNVLDVADVQWFGTEGQAFGRIGLAPVLDASVDCQRDEIRPEEQFCEQLDIEFRETFQQEQRSASFYSIFVNSTGANVYTYPALTHPIFYGSQSTPEEYELILFTGQSWVLTELIASNRTYPDGRLPTMQQYFDTDPEFLSVLHSIIFSGNYVDIVTTSVPAGTVSDTPVGMRWFWSRDKESFVDRNYPTADQSRPEMMTLSCATCDEVENPCLNGGICEANRTCTCVNGGSGALCQEPPLGNSICEPFFNNERFDFDGGDCCGASCVGPECGLAGVTSPFGFAAESQDEVFGYLGYEYCEDPKLAPLTIELSNFEVLADDFFNRFLGFEPGTVFCSTAAINVRCDGISYLHFPQHIEKNGTRCAQNSTETIRVPFGSTCELSTNLACFGIVCINHDIAVYYGDDTLSEPIQGGRVDSQTQFPFGVPSKCLTKVLQRQGSAIFDPTTHQGMAARALSNDFISEFLCNDGFNEGVEERYALSVFNSSMQFKSTNWDAFQCHGFGIPALQTKCSNFSVTSLVLGSDVVSQPGTIPTEIALLRNLESLVLRQNILAGSLPSEIGLLSKLSNVEIWDNAITGAIPSEIGVLTSLTTLALANNSMTGTVPTEMGNMFALRDLWLEDNAITGAIPSEMGRMTSLGALSFFNTDVVGDVPLELLNLVNLQLCYLGETNLTRGRIPPSCSFTEVPDWRDSARRYL